MIECPFLWMRAGLGTELAQNPGQLPFLIIDGGSGGDGTSPPASLLFVFLPLAFLPLALLGREPSLCLERVPGLLHPIRGSQ